jgi:ABC-type Na+ efflux pump permease subunit
MKKYLFFYFFLILSTILSAQDSLRLDSLVHARLSEGQVNLLKGDLYHAGLSFQQVLDLARAGKSPLAESKVTDAYKGLISVSEKTYNYVKAYQLEVQYSNLRDSLLRRQYSLQQKNQEAGLRQYEKDLLKEQDTSKEKIRKLDQAMESLAGKEEQLKLYVSILAVAALVLSLLLLLLLLRWRRYSQRTACKTQYS